MSARAIFFAYSTILFLWQRYSGMKREQITIGLKVVYWSVIRGDGTKDGAFLTEVTSEPWELGSGEVVCKVAAKSGGVAISHLDALRYHEFHINPNWMKVLTALNQCPYGASGRCIANKIGFNLQKTDGILRRMKAKNLSQRHRGIWRPVLLSDSKL